MITRSIPTATYAVFAYLFLLPLSLFVAAVIWADKGSGVLYSCNDSLGIFDFVPPFVHPEVGDVYFVPAWKVNLVWFVTAAGAFLVPALIIWSLCRLWRKDKDHDA